MERCSMTGCDAALAVRHTKSSVLSELVRFRALGHIPGQANIQSRQLTEVNPFQEGSCEILPELHSTAFSISMQLYQHKTDKSLIGSYRKRHCQDREGDSVNSSQDHCSTRDSHHLP